MVGRACAVCGLSDVDREDRFACGCFSTDIWSSLLRPVRNKQIQIRRSFTVGIACCNRQPKHEIRSEPRKLLNYEPSAGCQAATQMNIWFTPITCLVDSSHKKRRKKKNSPAQPDKNWTKNQRKKKCEKSVTESSGWNWSDTRRHHANEFN